MLKSGEEILADIDATLNQLIQNATAISEVSLSALQDHELLALQKTQESLLARLIHMNHLLNAEKKGASMHKKPAHLEEKMAEFARVNNDVIHQVATEFSKNKKPRFVRKMRSQSRKSFSKVG